MLFLYSYEKALLVLSSTACYKLNQKNNLFLMQHTSVALCRPYVAVSGTSITSLLFSAAWCVCGHWPLRMATWVPPHAAWTTFPQPSRGSRRGELICRDRQAAEELLFLLLLLFLLPHLRGLGDGRQLQVFRVAPAVQVSVCRHGQAAVSIGADVLHLHPRQLPAHLCRSGAHVVMSKTWKMRE